MKDYSLEFEKLFYKDGSPQELKEIQELVNSNREIAKEYEMYVSFHNHISKRDRVNHSLNVLESVHNNSVNQKKTNNRLILALVGIIFLAIGLLLLFQNNTQKPSPDKAQELYAAYYEKPIIELNSRSANNNQSGIEYYENSNFLKAIVTLDTTGSSKGDQPLILLAKAISIHETSGMKEAQQVFDHLSSAHPSLSSTITWYKALNFLKHQEMNSAKKELHSIKESSNYYSKAQELLNEM